jgi:hypothetical protein
MDLWHLAFPLAVIGYVVLRNSQAKRQFPMGPPSSGTLPRMFLDRATFAPLVPRSGQFTAVVCALALALLWFRGKSILDQWLAIAMFAALMEQLIVSAPLLDATGRPLACPELNRVNGRNPARQNFHCRKRWMSAFGGKADKLHVVSVKRRSRLDGQ